MKQVTKSFDWLRCWFLASARLCESGVEARPTLGNEPLHCQRVDVGKAK
jgi:hypothetical protein